MKICAWHFLVALVVLCFLQTGQPATTTPFPTLRYGRPIIHQID
jgi:hypothetical protein